MCLYDNHSCSRGSIELQAGSIELQAWVSVLTVKTRWEWIQQLKVPVICGKLVGEQWELTLPSLNCGYYCGESSSHPSHPALWSGALLHVILDFQQLKTCKCGFNTSYMNTSSTSKRPWCGLLDVKQGRNMIMLYNQCMRDHYVVAGFGNLPNSLIVFWKVTKNSAKKPNTSSIFFLEIKNGRIQLSVLYLRISCLVSSVIMRAATITRNRNLAIRNTLKNWNLHITTFRATYCPVYQKKFFFNPTTFSCLSFTANRIKYSSRF